MKLLLDQNLSYRLVEDLKSLFPGITHVKFVGLENAEDPEISRFAVESDYCVDLQLLSGAPTKLTWLRFGSTIFEELALFMKDNEKRIKAFLEDDRIACLEF